jgi:hypothetical protein
MRGPDLVGNFGKQRRRSCFVTPSAGLAFSNTFSKPIVRNAGRHPSR